MLHSRTVETLDENLKTILTWWVPDDVSLAKVIEKQRTKEFQDLYLMTARLVKR